MDMMLVPVYADGDGRRRQGHGQPARAAEPRRAHRGGHRRRRWRRRCRAVGSIAFNERDQARRAGARHRLRRAAARARAARPRVRKGQPLAELYVPDWVAAQEEFLVGAGACRARDLAPLVDARAPAHAAGRHERRADRARRERAAQSQPRFTITAPIGGVVTELAVREGMTVMPGATLFRINGLSHRLGRSRGAGKPGGAGAARRARSRRARRRCRAKTFEGQVQALLPEVNAATRTLKARIELANPAAAWCRACSCTMQFTDMRARGAARADRSVIQTGKRTSSCSPRRRQVRAGRVEPARSGGRPRSQRLRPDRGGRVGQFLIDSEASLRASVDRRAARPGGERTHSGEAGRALGQDA